MSDVIVMYFSPVWVGKRTGYKYDIEYNGELVVMLSKAPLGDAARWCEANGMTGRLELWRHDTSFPAMTGEISKLAKLTVSETETTAPRFVKWQPFNRTVFEN